MSGASISVPNGMLAIDKSGNGPMGVRKQASAPLEAGMNYEWTAIVDKGTCNSSSIIEARIVSSTGQVIIAEQFTAAGQHNLSTSFTVPASDTYFMEFERIGNNSNCTFYINKIKLVKKEVITEVCTVPVGEYRYGFNGMEKDDEVKGGGNSYDYGARMYDSRLGRWLSIDEMVDRYPYVSPYNYALDMPIIATDREGRDIGIVVTSMANSPGAGKKGHMAIVVGNDDIGYWIFSVELKKDETDPTRYVLNEEVVFTAPVQKIEAMISGKKEIEFYGHQEKTMEDLLIYMANNAPGVENPKETEGFGYDRMAVLNETTPEQEEAFLQYLLCLTKEDYKRYEIVSGNCCSITMDKINEFVGDVIKDNTVIDIPNREFDKIAKDIENWTVVMDNKASNDAKREAYKREQKQTKKESKEQGASGKSKNPRFL